MMSIKIQKFKNIAADMFTYFEVNFTDDALPYARRINLVLAFCDYINDMPDWQLCDWLNTQDIPEIKAFRNFINQGADAWLGDQIKTICY